MNQRPQSASGPALPAAAPIRAARGRAGFTLVELVLVMSVLVIVLAVAAPSLSRFFRGRTLDSETRRFVALTRYAQSRAVSEGIPMVLWIDSKAGAYGLQADSSYQEQDAKAVEYQLNKDVQIQVEQSVTAQRRAAIWKGNGGFLANLPKIRFTPDGFLSESSPELIVLRQNPDDEVQIAPSLNRLNYEVQTNQLQRLRR